MKRNQIEHAIIAASLDTLAPEDEKALQSQLAENPQYQKLHEEYTTLVRMGDAIASKTNELDDEFTLEVMRIVQQTPNRKWLHSAIAQSIDILNRFRHHLGRNYLPYTFAAGCAVALILVINIAHQNLVANNHNGRDSASYSGPTNNSDLFHFSFGNLLASVEGGLGTIVLIVAIALGLACFATTHKARNWFYRSVILIFSLSILALALKAIVVQWR